MNRKTIVLSIVSLWLGVHSVHAAPPSKGDSDKEAQKPPKKESPKRAKVTYSCPPLNEVSYQNYAFTTEPLWSGGPAGGSNLVGGVLVSFNFEKSNGMLTCSYSHTGPKGFLISRSTGVTASTACPDASTVKIETTSKPPRDWNAKAPNVEKGAYLDTSYFSSGEKTCVYKMTLVSRVEIYRQLSGDCAREGDSVVCSGFAN